MPGDMIMAETTNDTPAITSSASDAPAQIAPNVDLLHPAVDGDPRANTTPLMNRIDFNDPRPTAVIAAAPKA